MMCVFLCILSQFHVHGCELSQIEIGLLGIFTPYSLEDDTNQGIFSSLSLVFFPKFIRAQLLSRIRILVF